MRTRTQTQLSFRIGRKDKQHMDTIELPILPINTPLQEAFDAMKAADRSAVVSPDEHRLWLFKAGWVVAGMSRGEKTLADLEKRCRVKQVTPKVATEMGIDLAQPHLTMTLVEDFLDKVDRRYLTAALIPSVRKGMAMIITRHEGLAAAIGSGPASWYCTNPDLEDPHHYEPPPLPADRRCRYDGWKIVCA
jgi:hypothetical protein